MDGPLELQRLYRSRFSEEDARTKDKIWKVLVGNYFQKWIPPGASVLDVGCGYGEFLNHLHAANRVGIDMNPDAANHLDPNVEFHLGDVGLLTTLPSDKFDIIFTSNLMEHLVTKRQVEAMVKEIIRLLRPGGQFIAMGPNIRYVKDAYWDFWDHHTPITDRSLVELLLGTGFEVISSLPRFLPYTTLSRVPKSPALVRLYLRIPLIWLILGKQFLVRASKKGHATL